MERYLSESDKMRKAEEIYYRRNNANARFDTLNEINRKKKTYFGSKILLEILILTITAITIFSIKNKDYIFNKEFLEKISMYNIDLSEKFKSFIVIEKNNSISNQENENIINNEQETQNENNQISIVENDENNIEIAINDKISNSEELKNTIQFRKPIDGIITSRFGSRLSNYKNVGKNHTGIDISADLGTSIKATMSGIVEQVSSEGDYGNHLRISKDNICTLYAHCQKVYVEEGQEISIGQEIATVGSTGNSTGPHLHFEIRIDDNPIDPTEIIDF